MSGLQARIRERVDAYNTTPFQKREGSRRSVFASEERPLLGTLPAAPFEISQWVYGRKVGRNGHVVWCCVRRELGRLHDGDGVVTHLPPP